MAREWQPREDFRIPYHRRRGDEIFDPERGEAAAEKLKALGVRGVLIKAAEQGRITQVVCKMPECYSPEELGGACYFEPVIPHQTDWMPTADHFPLLKSRGGHRTVNNVSIANRLCNRLHYSIEPATAQTERKLEQVRSQSASRGA